MRVTVELFGSPRLICGQKTFTLNMESEASLGVLIRELSLLCPKLVGRVIKDDISQIHDSYTFNLNGRKFIKENSVSLSEGDTVMLISSQAGG